jgi:hypothetical protein
MELSSVKKTKIRAALENKYMSSDEECQDVFITPAILAVGKIQDIQKKIRF